MSEPVNKEENMEDDEIVEYSSSDEYEEHDENDCEHTFEVDLVDIDPDRAQEITYCTKCFFILKR